MDSPLTKIIAASGLASRRQAETLIRQGLVKVNGQVASLGDRADAARDAVSVRGRLLKSASGPIYLKFNKPRGYVCTNRNFPGEKNIFSLLNRGERLFVAGRLDKDSRGLLLITNDGELTQRLTHPSFQHDKVYEVRLREKFVDAATVIKRFRQGVEIGEGDGIVKAKEVKYLQNHLFIITLSEGKKRQIRRMFGALNLAVTDLRRVELSGLKLGNLAEGQWAILSPTEVQKLKTQIYGKI